MTRFFRSEPIAGLDPNANPTPPGLGASSLRRANLQNVTLNGGASFEGVDLRCANLQGLRMGGDGDPVISFRNANLMFADLRGADLSRASFQGANLRFARIDRETRLPTDGFEELRDDAARAAAYAAAYDQADVSFIRVDDLIDANRLLAAGLPVSRFDRSDRVPIPNCAQSI
ncbi:MAG: pentapeptide repeat-containing protein [Myxococcales bacterium]|nr:pentapeptide repeat-containing protein [Myxococcales bacterium]